MSHISDNFILERKSTLKIVESTLKKVIQTTTLDWISLLQNEVIPDNDSWKSGYPLHCIIKEITAALSCTMRWPITSS